MLLAIGFNLWKLINTENPTPTGLNDSFSDTISKTQSMAVQSIYWIKVTIL